jgi:hypothetical protein
MAIGVHIVNTPLSDAKTTYEEGWRLIEERGLASPAGRLSHTAWLTGDVLHVFDVWESPEQMGAFMKQLQPILEEVGMQVAGQPDVGEVLRRS